MSEPHVIAVQVRVHGVVQGVFFRVRTRDQACRLGVLGWVRNEADGTVAAHFEGPREAVESLVAWCAHGPEAARVERVDRREAAPVGAHDFEVTEPGRPSS